MDPSLWARAGNRDRRYLRFWGVEVVDDDPLNTTSSEAEPASGVGRNRAGMGLRVRVLENAGMGAGGGGAGLGLGGFGGKTAGLVDKIREATGVEAALGVENTLFTCGGGVDGGGGVHCRIDSLGSVCARLGSSGDVGSWLSA